MAFKKQKFLILMKSKLLIFCYMDFVFALMFKKTLPNS
jgi:hypothetical protein